MTNPVSDVQWVHRDSLHANSYNPNHVAPPELALLALSIVEDGWTQPIVCYPDGTIVDGFHRYKVSGNREVYELTDGYVPVVYVSVDETHGRMSTIRHNRARGTHGVVPMSSIIKGMLDSGVTVGEICRRLGMEDEEVYRLADRAGMPASQAKKQQGLGHAWVPDGGGENG